MGDRFLTPQSATLYRARMSDPIVPVQVVAGIAILGDRVLLIKSNKHGVATPGGKVKPGETHEEALRREFVEETGLAVTRFYPSRVCVDEQPTYHCHIYRVDVEDGVPRTNDPGEIEMVWWGDPRAVLESSIPRDYPYIMVAIADAAALAARAAGRQAFGATVCCADTEGYPMTSQEADMWRMLLRLEREDSRKLREQLAVAKAWEETAAQFARNADYYRGLLDQVAAHLGPEVYVADDGSVMDEPIRAKLPDMVAEMVATLERLRAAADPASVIASL